MARTTLPLNRLAGGIIPYALREGFPIFNFSDEENSAEEEYIIHKFDMGAFHAISLPPPVVFNGNIQNPFRRAMPGQRSLRTERLEFRPLKEDLPQDPFGLFPDSRYQNDYMVVHITYGTDPKDDDENDDDDPETFLEVGFDSTAEVMKYSSTRVHWGDEDKVIWRTDRKEDLNTDNDIPATLIIPTTTYRLNWKQALNPDFNLFRSLIGRVNGVTDPLFFNAPKDTILFQGFSGQRQFLWGGPEGQTITPWNLTFKFIGKHIQSELINDPAHDPDKDSTSGFGIPQKPSVKDADVAGWNHFYRPSTGYWEILKNINGRPLYSRTSTFGQMFRSGGLL